jgi:hypothetical protein
MFCEQANVLCLFFAMQEQAIALALLLKVTVNVTDRQVAQKGLIN